MIGARAELVIIGFVNLLVIIAEVDVCFLVFFCFGVDCPVSGPVPVITAIEVNGGKNNNSWVLQNML